MYRKYQSSTKSSRNERLAQLSEQESVIEKKKREILAKLEAQKKKETQEALRKLEPSSMLPITDKKEGAQSFSEYSLTSEKDVEDGEPKVTCPRNAFSNDGSFLDQFKKLSSEMSHKNLDLSISASLTRRHEDFDGQQKLRREYNLDESIESPKKKLQASNVEHQLSSAGLVQLVPHYKIPGTQASKPNNQALYFTAAEAESKAIPSRNILDSPMCATDQNTENVKSFRCSHIQSSPITPLLPMKTQCVSTVVSLQVEAIPNSKLNETRREEYSDGGHPISNVTEKALAHSDNGRNESRSYPKNEFSRVSPALTDYDAENKDEEQSRNGGGEESEGPDSCVKIPGNKRSVVRMNVPENFLNSKRTLHDTEEGTIEGKMKCRNSGYDSIDSDSNSKDSYHFKINASFDDQLGKGEHFLIKDSHKGDCEDEINCSNVCDEREKKTSFPKSSKQGFSTWSQGWENQNDNEKSEGEDPLSRGRRKRKRKSRWGDELVDGNSSGTGMNSDVQVSSNILHVSSGPGGKIPMLSKLTRSDPGLIQYARQTFGSANLSEEDWKKAEDHYKINLLYQDMVKKRAEIDRLEKAGKFKYEYDSDEDIEGGTWEHKLRQQEMMATQLWAEELTRQAAGKHHIGDFLPPEELERFLEKYNAVKQGRNPDLSDYKEFKLKENNVGYRLLQKMGWNEGQGLGQDGTGITNPVNKASTRHENQGLGVDRPDGLQAGDDEYDAYRKRMMLAYRFRPNPLNNPRRPYY